MKAKDIRYIDETVENEGFDYTFAHYSNFEDIKDDEFHRLRLAYLDARRELIEYCALEDC